MNKASGGDGIPAEVFKILKDDAVKVLHSIRQQIWKTQQWPQFGKGQFSFHSQRRAMPKNAQTTRQLSSFHILARLCSESFKPGFSSRWTENFQCTSWVLKRQRNQRSNCQHPLDHRKIKRTPEKQRLLYWLCQSLWLYASQLTVDNSSRDGNTRPPYLPPEKSACWSGSNS